MRKTATPSTKDSPDARAALRGMGAVGAALRPSAAALAREEAARDARERRALTAYLRGLARAGARTAALPAGAGLLSGAGRGTATRRSAPGSTAAASAATMPGLADLGGPAHADPEAALRLPVDLNEVDPLCAGHPLRPRGPGRGNVRFDIASSHESHQVNKSRALAGVGVRYQPAERGFLAIARHIEVREDWSLKWHMRVAHAYGWTGLLVQAFDAADGALTGPPIDAKGIEFDETGGGSLLSAAELTVALPGGSLPGLLVDPGRWYAIWVWCGGGIRAAGWQTYLGTNVGSDAASKLDVTVGSIALYFTPITALLGAR